MTRRRRSTWEVEELCALIVDVVSRNLPMTVRQVFYQLVGLGLIGKSEAEYNNVVVRLLARLRLEGVLPWSWPEQIDEYALPTRPTKRGANHGA